jgi:cell shape-determining protein MreC
MSTIGKFFVVLNLALAALFVGVSASLIGTGESWREQAETADAAHTVALADKDKALAATTAEREQLREEKSRLLTENNSLKADNKALTENLETESQKNSELTEKLTGIESKLGDLESTNRDQAGQLENMRRTANQMRDERDAAMDARDAAQSAATQAQQSERLALGRMKDLEQQLATASQRAEKAETERDVVVAATHLDPSEISVQPMLEGTVLSVDKSGGATFVVIDLGKKDSVKIGYTFDVYDGATYKGKIRVETVNQGSAGASVTLTGTAAIAAGDRVTTRL